MKEKDINLSFLLYNENSILIGWTKIINESTLKEILIYKNKLSKIKSIQNTINAYNSLLIKYKSEIKSFNEEVKNLKGLYKEKVKTQEIKMSKHWKIPVCYGKKYAPDIYLVSKKLKLSSSEIIKLHSSKKYTLYFIGFLPGFIYLGQLDSKLRIPRKQNPSKIYMAGSIGIADYQTGIYPNDSPGGWNIIGNSPLTYFDPFNKAPCFANSGDTIEFYSINEKEYNQTKHLSNNNLNFIKELND